MRRMCPICGNRISSGTVCDACHFDLSKDYEFNLTLSLIKKGEQSTYIQRKQYEEAKIAKIGLAMEQQQAEKDSETQQARKRGNACVAKKNYQRAYEWYLIAAEGDDAEAMYQIGALYEKKRLTTADPFVEAMKWYRKAYTAFEPAAQRGEAHAMYRMGCLSYIKPGIKADKAAAFEWHQKAAATGHVRAMHQLGSMYQIHYTDNVKAVEWYRKAAEAGDGESMNMMGQMYYYGSGVAQDKKQALYWYEQGSKAGFEQAEKNRKVLLEEMASESSGSSPSAETSSKSSGSSSSKEISSKSAKKMIIACVKCKQKIRVTADKHIELTCPTCKTVLDINGPGWVKEKAAIHVKIDYGEAAKKADQYYAAGDYAQAFEWYQKAAPGNKRNVLYNLGVCYEYGRGVAEDPANALMWYRKAADQGDADAMNKVGKFYHYGMSVSKDYSEAAKWYRKAADQGHALAMYNMGVCYEYGRGVTKDLTEAIQWYSMAANAGDPDAKARYKQLIG